MSDSDRGERNSPLWVDLKYLIAILLACGVGLGLGYLEGYQAERYQNSPRDYAEEAKRNAIFACQHREPSAVADCVYSEIESAQEASQAQQDLNAQQWMARWAALLTIITLGTTLISWIALGYLRDTFTQTAKGAGAAADATAEMVEANNIARETANRQLRAYLSIETLAIASDRDAFVWSLKNFGQTPAHNVRIIAWVCLAEASAKVEDLQWQRLDRTPHTSIPRN